MSLTKPLKNCPRILRSLFKKLLGGSTPDFSGKDVQMLTVIYPPDGHDPVHRHNAHAFIYVLEGSVVMALNGGQPVTLTAGQMNTSKNESGKLLIGDM